MFVYLWTNTTNGKKYVGKSQRDPSHSYMGSGKHFKAAVKKYGKEAFKRVILQECGTAEELIEAEQYWIDHYDASNNDEFYNISPMSGGGHHGRDMSGANNPMWGRKHPNHKPHIGKDNGMYGSNRTGDTNPNAKSIELISPDGTKYVGKSLKALGRKLFGDEVDYLKLRRHVTNCMEGKRCYKTNPFYGWKGRYL